MCQINDKQVHGSVSAYYRLISSLYHPCVIPLSSLYNYRDDMNGIWTNHKRYPNKVSLILETTPEDSWIYCKADVSPVLP